MRSRPQSNEPEAVKGRPRSTELASSIMPAVSDFTCLDVSACPELTTRCLRHDPEPVTLVTGGPAEIVKLDPASVRFLLVRGPGFRCIFLSFLQFPDLVGIAENQFLLHLHNRDMDGMRDQVGVLPLRNSVRAQQWLLRRCFDLLACQFVDTAQHVLL